MRSASRPPGATPEYYRAQGHAFPPEYGPLAATTPGTPGGIMVMVAEYGRLSLAEVLAPAIGMAEWLPDRGADRQLDRAGQGPAQTVAVLESDHAAASGRGAEAPYAGEIFKQADLAATLRKLVEASGRRWTADRAAEGPGSEGGADGESWARLRAAFSVLLGQFGNSAYLASAFVGGQHVSRGFQGRRRQPRSDLAGARCQAARSAGVPDEQRFWEIKRFVFSPQLLRRLGTEHWYHWGSQSMLMADGSRLQHLRSDPGGPIDRPRSLP